MKNSTEGLVKFLSLPYERKLQGFELLRRAGTLVLSELQRNPNDSDAKFNSIRIATELLEVTQWMSHTKAYDTSEVVKSNHEMAFEIANKFYGETPCGKLIPFIVHLLYYEHFKTQPDGKESSLLILYKACLKDLMKSTQKLYESDKPWYAV